MCMVMYSSINLCTVPSYYKPNDILGSNVGYFVMKSYDIKIKSWSFFFAFKKTTFVQYFYWKVLFNATVAFLSGYPMLP